MEQNPVLVISSTDGNRFEEKCKSAVDKGYSLFKVGHQAESEHAYAYSYWWAIFVHPDIKVVENNCSLKVVHAAPCEHSA